MAGRREGRARQVSSSALNILQVGEEIQEVNKVAIASGEERSSHLARSARVREEEPPPTTARASTAATLLTTSLSGVKSVVG